MNIYKIKLFCFLVIFNITNLFAQWEADVRLTNNIDESLTSFNNTWSIAASGNILHVVWRDKRDGFNGEIYYKRSADGGSTWQADVNLSNNPEWSASVSFATSGSTVVAAWEDFRDGNMEIYYSVSFDNGLTWTGATRLTNDVSGSILPSVAINGSDIKVTWSDFRHGNTEIFFKSSNDGGSTWSSDMRLTNNGADSQESSIAMQGNNIHLVWIDNRDTNFEIYYKHSSDGGLTWGTDTRLTNDIDISRYPSIAVANQLVHIIWIDTRGITSNSEVYYKRSADGGLTWGTDTRLTNNEPYTTGNPSIAASGSYAGIVYYDFKYGESEISYLNTSNGGVNWQDTRLTNDNNKSEAPSIAVSGQAVHVVWHDTRDGNYEIYYKRNLQGNTSSQNCNNPTATATQPTCNNPTGSIIVNTPLPASGITYFLEGIVPAAAAISNTTGIFSNLSAGSYSLSVADNSNQTCTTSQSFNINALPLLQSTLNDTICPGLSYLFNGQSLSVGGTYYDTLTTSSGCDSIITLNLTIDPVINTTLNETICFGESYNFNGRLLTASGIYIDTLPSITQCISIATLNLSVLPNLTSVIDTTICNGDSLGVGGNVYYQGGTYNIPLLSQTGCDSSILLKLGIYVLDTLVNTNGNIISSAQNGVQYQWINCDDNTIINNADQQSYTVLENGVYAVIINDGSCIDTSTCVQVVISGIAKNQDSDFEIYPNPATDWLQVTGIKEATDIHIYNIQGKLIWSIKNQQTEYKLNLKENSISSSMYIVEIMSGQFKEYYKLFVE